MVSRVSSSSGSTVYCYDANGNQVSAGDGNPNSTAPNQRLLSYAVHDKPLSVRTTGSTGSNGRLTTYQYGPGREIVKRLDGPANGLVDIEVDYVGGVEVSYRPDAGGASQRREYKRYLANYLQTGTLKGALTGGLSAGLFHQIGAHFDQMAIANKGADNLIKGTGVMVDGERIGGLNAGQFAGKIAAHAAAGGVMTVLQGGKFGHGFATAGFGEAVSPAVVQFAGDSAGKAFIAGVLVGGTTSALVGGKFANGAVTAAFQWAFNHLMPSSRAERYNRAAAAFDRISSQLQAKRFDFEKDAHFAFAEPMGRLTQLYGFEVGANIVLDSDGSYRLVDFRLGDETSVNLPEYSGDSLWVAFTHTHPASAGFSGGARYHASLGKFESFDGDIGFAFRNHIDAYVTTPSATLGGSSTDFHYSNASFRGAALRAKQNETITHDAFVRRIK